jgi:hypothetical protein
MQTQRSVVDGEMNALQKKIKQMHLASTASRLGEGYQRP